MKCGILFLDMVVRHSRNFATRTSNSGDTLVTGLLSNNLWGIRRRILTYIHICWRCSSGATSLGHRPVLRSDR